MQNVLLFTLLTLFYLGMNAQNENPNYDKELAASLGADDYGMRGYYFVILKTGTNTIDDQEKVNAIFRGHMDNIGRMVKDGKLIIAGPLGKNDNQYRGLYIFTVPTKEEVEALLETDPAITEKLLAAEIYEWYGSAALPAYLDVHQKIEKMKH